MNLPQSIDVGDGAPPVKLSYATLKRRSVSLRTLAHRLDVPEYKLRVLADLGYLYATPMKWTSGEGSGKNNGDGGRGDSLRVVKARPTDPPPPIMIRVVDRISILLWLLGMDRGITVPDFSVYVEKEIQRIAKLPEPYKTEQAVRLLLRYRDAETVAAAVVRAGAPAVETVDRLRESERLKRRARSLAAMNEQTMKPISPVRGRKSQKSRKTVVGGRLDSAAHPHPRPRPA